MSAVNGADDYCSDWERLETIKNVDEYDGSSMSKIIQNIHSDDLNGSTRLIDASKHFDEGFISSISTKATAPVSLLVESLVQQLCSLLDPDPVRAHQLYTNICTQLHRMNLIDETYLMTEFDLMRSQYQRALYQLATVARGQTDLPLSLQSVWPVVDPAQKSWSRYHREFEELNFIAGGGFGQVYRARHKLDGIEYAVKKITIKYTTIKRVLSHLSEVKTFASLNHTNIVPYKAAWLEPLFNNPGETTAKTDKEHPNRKSNAPNRTRNNLTTYKDDSSMDEEDEEDIDDDNSLDFSNLRRGGQYDLNDSSSSDFIEFVEFGESVDPTQEVLPRNNNTDAKRVICEFNNNNQQFQDNSSGNVFKSQMSFNQSQPHLKLKWATLYIQMALRPLTLRAWLDDRNKCDDFNVFYQNFLRKSVVEQCNDGLSSDGDDERPRHYQPNGNRTVSISKLAFEECIAKEWNIEDVAMDIFCQLLNGLNYIHLQNIVHHDIKPSNVFIGCERNGNLYVQLGDFGLACPLETNHSRDGIIGTFAYAAPEQLSGHCNPKSDLYSLGIILIELLIPFKTDMERVKTIDDARKGNLPQDIPSKYKSILRRLFQPHKRRPDTVDLQKFISKLTQNVRQSSPELSGETEDWKLEDESLTIDLQRQVEELTSKLNALQKQISITESSCAGSEYELKPRRSECESSRRSSISSANDRLFVAQCLSENDATNDGSQEISSTTDSISYSHRKIIVENSQHPTGLVSSSTPSSSIRVQKCDDERKPISQTNEEYREIQTASLSSRSVDIKHSFDEISDKDKMIALLQSKLLEKTQKESSLMGEINRLKSMLKGKNVPNDDFDLRDELV